MASDRKYSAFSKLILKKFFDINVEERAVEWSQMVAKQDEDQVQIRELTDSVSACKQQIEQLTRELDTSRLNLASVQKEKQRSEEECDRLKFNLKKANSAIDKLQDEQKKLQKQVDESRSIIQDIEISLRRKAEDLEKCLATIDMLKNSMADSELHLREATSESEIKRQEAARLQAHKAELEDLVKELEKTIRQRDAELADSNSKLNTLKEEIEEVKKQLEKAKEDIDRSIRLRQELTKGNAKLEGEKANLKHQADTQKEIIDEQQAEIDALKKANDDLQAQLAASQDEIEKLRQEQTPKAIMDKYESELTRLNNLVQSLENNIQSRDNRIADLEVQLASSEQRLADAMKENEALNQHVSKLGTAQQEDDSEEDKSLQDQVKILAQELSEARSNVQRLTEELDRSRNTIKKLEATFAASSQKCNENIEAYKARLLEKEETINELKDRIKQLEAALAEMQLLLNESNDTDDDSKPSSTLAPTSANSPVQPQQSDVDETSSNIEDATHSDLPTIAEDGSSVGERAIKAVINCETGERIESEEFFRRPKEEISTLSRKLEIISITGDSPLFICEKCKQPVKISKITRSKGETLFFAHCHHGASCEWRKESEAAAKPAVILDDAEIKSAKAEKSRYEKLKELIYNSLNNQEALGQGVNDVELDKRIKSNKSKSWRLFDVYAKWQGIDVVFKLQRSTDYLKYLVGIDEFCKQEKLFIIWVFGSDSATSYSYLLGTTYQTTLFDNRSCVFILDREAENASKESEELKLKCNWLTDGKHWYHTLERTNSNGILVSLADLCFNDTETYKPYYKDRNNVPDIEASEIFELKPGVFKYRRKALWGIYNQSSGIQSECKYKEIYLNEKGRIVAIIDDIPEDRRGYLSDDGNETHTTKDEIAPGIFVLNIFERLCLADKSNRPISKYYDAMKYWCDDRMVIKLGSWYGIIDFHGRVIREPQYDKLRIVSDNKARVTDYQGKYSIDCDGNPIPDEIIPLHGNYQKVRHLDKWGIMNAKGKLIVDYQYNEIATFRNRFFGFTDAGTIIKLENIERFNYRIPLWAKYVGTSPKGHLLFNCNGIILTMINHQNNRSKREIGKEYMVALINIMRDDKSNVTYYIAAWNEKSKDMKFVPTDFDSDYKSGQRYTGVIVKISPLKNRKRFFVSFKDNRQTYVNIGRNAPIFDLLRNGSSITLEKIDFNPFYESTKWKVIK